MTEIQPSIGIEIELPWKVMLARVDPEAASILAEKKNFYMTSGEEKERLQAAFDALDAQYKSRIAAAHMAGIGKGNDGYAEFALRPQHSEGPIINQVDYLYETGILREGERYPLHVTLGGFPLTRAAGQLLFALEVVGETRPERVLQPNSWNRKGAGGAMNRQPHELALGYEQGVEFRTLELQSIFQLSRVLQAALGGGRAILEDETWQRWQETLVAQAAIKEIDITIPWPKIQDDPSPWLAYADALQDRTWVEDSSHRISELVG